MKDCALPVVIPIFRSTTTNHNRFSPTLFIVRYLPRIKKCSDAIPGVALAIGNEDWAAVRDFATVVADDTILPMKLYVSSLTGGGTNVKVRRMRPSDFSNSIC